MSHILAFHRHTPPGYFAWSYVTLRELAIHSNDIIITMLHPALAGYVLSRHSLRCYVKDSVLCSEQRALLLGGGGGEFGGWGNAVLLVKKEVGQIHRKHTRSKFTITSSPGLDCHPFISNKTHTLLARRTALKMWLLAIFSQILILVVCCHQRILHPIHGI